MTEGIRRLAVIGRAMATRVAKHSIVYRPIQKPKNKMNRYFIYPKPRLWFDFLPVTAVHYHPVTTVD